MSDILLRREGRIARVTLNRPEALNALSYGMCKALDAALVAWASEPDVALVVIDAAGGRAFCAGGDIAELYAEGIKGNFTYGQQFWRDEYRMNDLIGRYPKPIVTLINGFCMGGGVGVACHASHRVAGESAQIAMPECAIGLVPDVGGSALLARAPGRLGAWLGVTGARMGPGDAIYAGFADCFVPEEDWPELIASLEATGDVGEVSRAARPAPATTLAALQPSVDRHFQTARLAELHASLSDESSEFASNAVAALRRASPLAVATTLTMQHLLGSEPDLRAALELEYRVTFRAQERMDFLEGVRAMIIDRDRKPKWRHTGTESEVAALVAPLGSNTLTFPDAHELAE